MDALRKIRREDETRICTWEEEERITTAYLQLKQIHEEILVLLKGKEDLEGKWHV